VLTESRPRLSGAIMSTTDHTLDALLDQLQNYDNAIAGREIGQSIGALIRCL